MQYNSLIAKSHKAVDVASNLYMYDSGTAFPALSYNKYLSVLPLTTSVLLLRCLTAGILININMAQLSFGIVHGNLF
jgi:hypothetical protein